MFSFATLLEERSVISLVKGAGKYSCQTGRSWRSSLTQLGFNSLNPKNPGFTPLL